jgi:CRP/FNR family cyclic AMP-dependent transcriptional regulator
MMDNQLLWAYVAKEEDYPEDATIIKEGSWGDWAYVLLEGRAKVTKKTSDGTLTLGMLEEGAVFGEVGFFEVNGGTRSASVIASDGPVRVGVLDSHLLRKDYEALSLELRELLKALVIRLKKSSDRLSSIEQTSN